MFDKGRSKEDVFRDLNVFHNMDMKYSSGRILGSMCTKPDPVGLEAYKMFIETNLGDPGLFKGTALMEQEVINSLGNQKVLIFLLKRYCLCCLLNQFMFH